MNKKICKYAFTLAEVLITLAIIGVVAALTIPTVVKNYQKSQTVVKVKKMYSLISNIENQIIAENGGLDPYFNHTETFANNRLYYDKYWKPKLNVVKSCNSAVDCGYSNDVPFMLLNGAPYWITSYHVYLLADGSAILFYTGTTAVYVDINGPKNGPNVLGKDFFYLSFVNNNGVYQIKPKGAASTYKSKKWFCNKKGAECCQGEYCLALIMADGWQIKYDW